MSIAPHRNSISKRSSSIIGGHNRFGNHPNDRTVELGHGQNEMRTTISRLEYLNNKFNIDPSFDIEVSGEEEGQEAGLEHEGQALKWNSEFMKIDIQQKETAFAEYSCKILDSLELLKPLFKYIRSLEMNLDSLSNEMEALKARLTNLNEEIKKNAKVDQTLTPVLMDILISPQTVQIICSATIDENWVNQLTVLSEKKEILQAYKDSDKVNQDNITHLSQIIENLEKKCVERIKKFLIDHIKAFRGIDSSSVKIQKKLLSVKEIMVFLKDRNPKLAKEFENAYIYTIRWYYYFNFVKYISSLENLTLQENEFDTDSAFRHTTRPLPSSSTSTFRSLLLDNSDSINEYLINLPRRLQQLEDESNKYSILAQIAESANSNLKFFMEQIFQFLNQTILDNFTIEFNFIMGFFDITDNEELSSTMKQMFSPIFKLGTNFTKYLLQYCKSDYFGILHTIRRIQKMEYEIQMRCLPELFQTYLNSQLMALWPAFQNNIDILCDNITATLMSTSVIKQIMNNKANLLIPLKATQSFSMVLSNMVKLVQNLVFELETSEPLNGSIERLSSTYEKGMIQLASNLDPNKRKLFLYVNFQLMYNVLDSDSSIKEKKPDLTDHYKRLVEAYS